MHDIDELLEESLRFDARGFEPTLPDPEGTFARRYRRRKMANLATAAAFLIVAGSAAGYGLHVLNKPKEARIVESPRIPWIDATPGETPQAQTSPAPASMPDCESSDLDAQFAYATGAAGNDANIVEFRNISTAPCALQGVPGVKLIRSTGTEISSHVSSDSYFPDNGNERVAVQPGVPFGTDAFMEPGLATLLFTWQDCNHSEEAAFVDVTIPGDGGTMRVAAPKGGFTRTAEAVCDGRGNPPGSEVNVNHFQRVDPQAPPPTDYSSLELTIEAPATVIAGTRLHYAITLTNHGTSTFTFSPCPAYRETISGDGIQVAGLYLLNCIDAPSIAAGESLTFDMYLDIPRSRTNAGSGFLDWSFPNGTGLKAPKGVPITILPE